MLGFEKSEVGHMYGHKHFQLHEAEVRPSGSLDPGVTVELRGFRRGGGVAPVKLTLSPEDAIMLGTALMTSGLEQVS